jgi:hypothetical protein
LDAYTAGRKSDRFSPAKLQEYCEALSLAAFEPEFYRGDGVIVETRIPFTKGPQGMSLAQAQARLRLPMSDIE